MGRRRAPAAASIRSRAIAALMIALGGAAIPGIPSAGAQESAGTVREHLGRRLAAGAPAGIRVTGEPLYARSALPRFYERRHAAAWTDDRGVRPSARALLRAIRAADREGLNPDDYHLSVIEAVLARLDADSSPAAPEPAALADLDLLLTDAFLTYGAHLVSGRVNPVTIHAEWNAIRRERDLVVVLEEALRSGRIEAALTDLLPNHNRYYQLRGALARYAAIVEQGGWPEIAAGSRLVPGSIGPRVAALRDRLTASGDLPFSPPADGSAAGAADTFDAALQAAVVRFQIRHGLDADGVGGPRTLEALNVPAAERARQLRLNMERWRWLPEYLGARHILVNIANYELEAVESGAVSLSMRVVVGRPYRRTPVFSDTMTYLVLNPYWHVPRNLAIQDIVPLIKSDPGYLDRQRIRVLGEGGNPEIDPATIDWTRVGNENFRYRLRQDPGPSNALGRMKFMFPNPFNVYMHDTPSRELFARTARGFSSGCIRLDRPMDLALYVLAGHPQGSRESLEALLKRPGETTLRLPEPIPIHLLYWTAWAEMDGSIHFRDDIYLRDVALTRALREPPAGP